MEFKSILVVGFALAALAFTVTAPAQTYKAEYKMSLVLGLSVGQGQRNLGQLSQGAHSRPAQHQAVPGPAPGSG